MSDEPTLDSILQITPQTPVKLELDFWIKLVATLVVTVGGAVGAGAWWMSSIDQIANDNKANIADIATAMQKISDSQNALLNRLGPTTWIQDKSEILDRIANLVERVAKIESQTVDRLYRFEFREWKTSLRRWILQQFESVPDFKERGTFPTIGAMPD